MNHAFSSLPFFGVIEIKGADAANFLHRQLSNHIENLNNQQACAATYNSAKGRVLANMLVVRHNDAFLLIAAADLCDFLLRRLNMFVLRSQVQLTRSSDWQVGGDVCTHSVAHDALQFDIIADGNRLIVPLSNHNSLILQNHSASSSPSNDSENAWFAREIHAGRPWISQATSELCVAQMLNQHRLGAVHFKKGCYPGQEIIARAQYRGQVKRGLVRTSSAQACNIGASLMVDDEEAGWVINQAQENGQWIQLCVIKHSAIEQTLHSDGITLTIAEIHFESAA